MEAEIEKWRGWEEGFESTWGTRREEKISVLALTYKRVKIAKRDMKST